MLDTQDVRVVAVDMDGTFLRSDGDYDRARFDRLRARLGDRGVRFVVASGNQDAQLRSFFDDPDEFAYVSDNGAWVRDGAEVISTARMDPALVDAISDLLDRLGIAYLASGPGMAYVPGHAGPGFTGFMARYYHRLTVVDDLGPVRDRIFKFALADERGLPAGLADEVSAVVGPGVSPVTSGHDSMDLNITGVHKASGLTELLTRWDVDPSQVAAFGDSGNDLEMLRLVGFSVAMANAILPVRDAARFRTGSNDEDGVVSMLERWFG